MPADIHPSAEVHPGARLGSNVRVDAGAVVEDGCAIGDGCSIGRNTIVWAGTVLGEGNRIFPFCSIGGEPQDKKYAGEDAPLVIGSSNTIREYCFINKGTAASGATRIGSGNWIMAYVHAAHDCAIGDDNVIANAVQLAGHVTVGSRAVIGGGTLFHQFRRVGSGAMVGGGERIRHDVPPYALVAEGVVSVNREGMRRAQYSSEAISAVTAAYKMLYREGLPLAAAVEAIAAMPPVAGAPLDELLEFLRLPDMQLLRPRSRQES